MLQSIHLLASLLSKKHPELTFREALSGIFGSISLACWLFLLLPQLLENYRNQSAEAISLTFIVIWFLGDVFNLVGGMWADLVPLVIVLAAYFCVQDMVLIGQVLYYGIRNRRREGKGFLESARQVVSEATNDAENQTVEDAEDDEEQPLLKRRRSAAGSITIPGSQSPMLAARPRRRSSAISEGRRLSSGAEDNLATIVEETDESGARQWLKNIISILAIFIIGALGWALAYESGAWTPSTESGDVDNEEEMAKGAQVLGYASAVLYMCARLPQIYKNYKDKSCEGLSLLFFILSVLGNLTYGAGILCHSTERNYVVKNVPWLIGSLGTMFEDFVIFVQFHLYRNACEAEEIDVAVS